MYLSLDPWTKPAAVRLDVGEPVFAEASGRVVLRASDGVPLAAAWHTSSVFAGTASGLSLGDAVVTGAALPGGSGTNGVASTVAAVVLGDSPAVVPGGDSDQAVDVGGDTANDAVADTSANQGVADQTFGNESFAATEGDTEVASTDMPDVADFDDTEPAFEFQNGAAPSVPAGGALGVGTFGAISALAMAAIIFENNDGTNHNPNGHTLVTPEPSPALVIGGGLAILAIRRRRRS
jgi:hypothetical protein